jgi:hypothetical protein
MEYQHTVVLTIDGVPVFRDDIGGTEDSIALDQRQITAVEEIKNRFRNISLDVKAGVHEVAAAFVARSRAESDYLLQSLIQGEGVPDVPRLHGIQIIGPYDARGISGTTASRDRVFIAGRRAQARATSSHARRRSWAPRAPAFRRPVGAPTSSRCLRSTRKGREVGGFEAGVQKGLMAILASTEVPLSRGTRRHAGHLRPATRMRSATSSSRGGSRSSSGAKGPTRRCSRSRRPASCTSRRSTDAQVKRMLADPRSESLVTNFAFQWLGVRRLDALDPDPRLYPTFDEDLRSAFITEMRAVPRQRAAR